MKRSIHKMKSFNNKEEIYGRGIGKNRCGSSTGESGPL